MGWATLWAIFFHPLIWSPCDATIFEDVNKKWREKNIVRETAAKNTQPARVARFFLV
jgi:hypothetical protein